MAVILTNMDMPKNCEDCFFQHSPSYHMWVCPNGCPLKSTDEMIAEIESQVFTDAYDGQFVGIDDVKQVINKYCKENTDG